MGMPILYGISTAREKIISLPSRNSSRTPRMAMDIWPQLLVVLVREPLRSTTVGNPIVVIANSPGYARSALLGASGCVG